MRKFNFMKSIVKIGICSTIVLSTIGLSTITEKAAAAGPVTIELISNSKEYLGTPYKYGAKAGSTSSFDCSSFTQFMFKGSGVDLPRTSAAQAKKGEKVHKSSLSMGDLVFFKTNGKSISHVGIYAGNNKFIHSSSQGVTISDLNSKYWSKRYVTAKRVIN